MSTWATEQISEQPELERKREGEEKGRVIVTSGVLPIETSSFVNVDTLLKNLDTV